MRREHFRISVGLLVILVHATCFLSIFYFKDDYLTTSQQVDMALMIMPITAAYVTAVVRSAIEHGQRRGNGPRMNLNYSIIIFSVTLISLAGLLFTVFGIDGAAQDDRRQVLVFEIAFGAIFGLIASDLFASERTLSAALNEDGSPITQSKS